MKETAPHLLKQLANLPECPIPLEDDVKVTGLKNPTCTVVLGFATDKVVREILNSNKQVKYLVVIEPNLSVFKSTLQRKYVGDLLRDTRIDWFLGISLGDLTTHLYKAFSDFDPEHGPRAAVTQSPEIVPDPFVFAPTGPGDDNLREELTRIVIAASSQCFLSMGCGPDSFNRWVQTAKNFDNLGKLLNGNGLKDKFWCPIVVVGAGPSMEDFIPYAKKYNLEKKALIIAVDASLRRLLKEGIKPHIVIRCERKLTGIFDGVTKDQTNDILYAAYNWCDPHFFNLFDNSIMLFRGNGVCLWTEYDHLQVNGGVSSGNAALELAWELSHKGNNVFLTGIDLCFIDDKTHVSGTKVEFDIEKSKDLWTKYKTNDGEERVTIPVWTRCRQEFETGLIKYGAKKPINVFNLSPKGAVIHGTTTTSWDAIEDKFKEDVYVKEKLDKHLKEVTQEQRDNFEKVKKESLVLLKEWDDELTELFNNLDDCFFNIKSEEAKIIKKMRTVYEPMDALKLARSYEKSLKKLYENPAGMIDKWKAKTFVDKKFHNLILDTVQLDVFKTENQAHALRNTVEVEFERVKIYCRLYQDLYQTIKHYIEQMIELLEE